MSDWEIIEAARKLTSGEKAVLRLLREDGRGNYDPRLTRSRSSLHKKGFADAPMQVGFGRAFYAVVQKPTDLGLRMQRYLGSAA